MTRARGGLLVTVVAVAAASRTPVLLCHAWVLAGDLDPATAKTVAGVAGPALSALGFLFILRIVMSWYPRLRVTEFPYVLAYVPEDGGRRPHARMEPANGRRHGVASRGTLGGRALRTPETATAARDEDVARPGRRRETRAVTKCSGGHSGPCDDRIGANS